jgi:hypothetical protein
MKEIVWGLGSCCNTEMDEWLFNTSARWLPPARCPAAPSPSIDAVLRTEHSRHSIEPC